MVMKHVCPASIQSQADFDALGSFLMKVLTCPVITLPGDEGPAGALDADSSFYNVHVPNGQASFNFSVSAANGSSTLGDAMFEPAKLCETDVNVDVNGDGMITDDVCVEVSNYVFGGVAQGDVTVHEMTPPSGFRFGALEFTPGSGDDATLQGIDASSGTITLDTSSDNSVMLHVYNFSNTEEESPSGSVEAETPGITPPATDTAASAPAVNSTGWRLVLMALAAILGVVLVMTPHRERARRR